MSCGFYYFIENIFYLSVVFIGSSLLLNKGLPIHSSTTEWVQNCGRPMVRGDPFHIAKTYFLLLQADKKVSAFQKKLILFFRILVLIVMQTQNLNKSE